MAKLNKFFLYVTTIVVTFSLNGAEVHALDGECISVTCADGSVHECGFDCSTLFYQGDTPGGTDSGSSGIDWQAEQRRLEQERLRREREHKLKLYKRAEEEARSRKEERSRQFEQNKQNALRLLKSGVEQLGPPREVPSGVPSLSTGSSGTGKTPGFQLKEMDEPAYTQGNQYSTPVDLSNISQDKPVMVSQDSLKKQEPAEKGLRTSYVPKPALQSLELYNYESKTRNDIIFDAFEIGRNDLSASIRHLENYLAEVNPDSLNVQEALSYIQGMAEGKAAMREKNRKSTENNTLFDPSADDSRYLTEAIVNARQVEIKEVFLKPGKPEVPIWQRFRDEAITESIAGLNKDFDALTDDDFQQCIKALEKRIAENPDQEGLQQAVEFFKGIQTFY